MAEIDTLVSLPRTLALVTRCYQSAEKEVRRLIREKYTAHDEVFINRLFYGELRVLFVQANQDKEVSSALAEDLNELFGDEVAGKEIRRISGGLVARVSYHEPHVEKVSGGDLGFTFVRPKFIRIEKTKLSHGLHEQGILCQAKRQGADGRWGSLTASQRRILPQHVAYLVLLLYGYADRTRKSLKEFSWEPCNGRPLTLVEEWLQNGDFPSTLTSPDLLEKLAMGIIGTNDNNTINTVICPGTRAFIRVEIRWRDGYPQPRPDDGSGSGGLGEVLSKWNKKAHHDRRIYRPPAHKKGYMNS